MNVHKNYTKFPEISRCVKSLFKKNKFNGLPRIQIETLIIALDMCIKKLAEYIFPNDGKGLFDEFISKKASEELMHTGITNAMKSCKCGSVEKRVLRTCLFAHLPAKRVYALIAGEDGEPKIESAKNRMGIMKDMTMKMETVVMTRKWRKIWTQK